MFLGIAKFLRHCFGMLLGKSSIDSIEYRILNAFTLLNGILNIIGVTSYYDPALAQQTNLFWLQMITGILFLVAFFISRIGRMYSLSFYFFMIIMFIFLTFNIVWNGGFQGGAHYYLITAALIGTIIAPNRWGLAFVIVMTMTVSLSIWLIEIHSPELIVNLLGTKQRVIDLGGNFLFTQLLNGVTVLILKNQFNVERNQSEKLLLNILPSSIASELRREGKVKPINYSDATVLFSDFVDFTGMASKMGHEEVFLKLNTMFTEFDKIVKRYKVEKIKTIGDAYMLAGGVPERNKTHHLDVAIVALAFRETVQRFVFHPIFENQAPWKIRMGVHSGPIVGGVVGSHKFIFDIWSDAVNLASRLEAASEPNRINVSELYCKKIDPFFECVPHGKQELKGKGAVSTYFLEKLKPEFSQDEFGFSPNRHFWNAYTEMNTTVTQTNT